MQLYSSISKPANLYVIAVAVGNQVNDKNHRNILATVANDVIDWITSEDILRNENDVLNDVMARFNFAPGGKTNVIEIP